MDEHKYAYSHRVWKWVIGILIVIAAFWIGFQCGRFATIMRGYGYYGYGYPMMGPGMMYGYGYPYYGYDVPPAEPAAPSATATTTAPEPYYYYGPGGMMRYMWGYYPQATSTQ